MACKISTYLDIPCDEVMKKVAEESGTEIFVARDPFNPLTFLDVAIVWPSGHREEVRFCAHDIAYDPSAFGYKMRELLKLRLVSPASQ